MQPATNLIAVLVALSILQGPARVVDGDTLVASGQRVRLDGIDAPETRQTCRRGGNEWRCGVASSHTLQVMIGRRRVRCEVTETDRYRRSIATCWSASTNLNAEMVRQGWAMAYRRYSTRYVRDEDAAKGHKAGVWASEFTPPWDWRRAARNGPERPHLRPRVSESGDNAHPSP